MSRLFVLYPYFPENTKTCLVNSFFWNLFLGDILTTSIFQIYIKKKVSNFQNVLKLKKRMGRRWVLLFLFTESILGKLGPNRAAYLCKQWQMCGYLVVHTFKYAASAVPAMLAWEHEKNSDGVIFISYRSAGSGDLVGHFLQCTFGLSISVINGSNS